MWQHPIRFFFGAMGPSLVLAWAIVRMIDWKGPDNAKRFVDDSYLRYVRLDETYYEKARDVGSWLESLSEAEELGRPQATTISSQEMTFVSQLCVVILLLTGCILIDLFIVQRFIPSSCYNCASDLANLPWHLFSSWLLLYALYRAVRTFHNADIARTNVVRRMESQGKQNVSESQQAYMRLREVLSLVKENILYCLPAAFLLFTIAGRIFGAYETGVAQLQVDNSVVTTFALYAAAGLLSIVITLSLFLGTELRDKHGIPLALKPRDQQDHKAISMGKQYIPHFTSEHENPFHLLHGCLTKSEWLKEVIKSAYEFSSISGGDGLGRTREERTREANRAVDNAWNWLKSPIFGNPTWQLPNMNWLPLISTVYTDVFIFSSLPLSPAVDWTRFRMPLRDALIRMIEAARSFFPDLSIPFPTWMYEMLKAVVNWIPVPDVLGFFMNILRFVAA